MTDHRSQLKAFHLSSQDTPKKSWKRNQSMQWSYYYVCYHIKTYLQKSGLFFKILILIGFCIRQVVNLDTMLFNFIQNLKRESIWEYALNSKGRVHSKSFPNLSTTAATCDSFKSCPLFSGILQSRTDCEAKECNWKKKMITPLLASLNAFHLYTGLWGLLSILKVC